MAAPMQLRPAFAVHGSAKSSFSGLTTAFQQMNLAPAAVGRTAKLQIEGACVCEIRGSASMDCDSG